MTMSFAKEVAAGFMAAVLEEPDPMERLRKASQLSATLAAEAAAGLSVAPALARAVRVHRSLPVAGTPAADSTIGRDEGGPYGVVLHPSLRYGPGHRHLLDVYVPYELYSRRRAAAAAAGGGGSGGAAAGGGGQLPRAPVVFFVHGGIWATGDRFHFAPLAVRLAQAGLVVAVVSYTLYPEAYADTMAAETLRALMWTLSNAGRFNGDPSRLAVMGHSAGGHLGALACLLLAALRTEEAAGRTPKQQQQQQQAAAQAAGAGGGDGWAPGPALALPRPQLFVGMSGIYHVARHHEFEESRGVHQISTMGRACGGPELWDEISPAAILARATAASAAAASQSAGTPGPSGTDGGSGAAAGNGGFYGAFALAGEAVPYRIGLDVSPSGAAAAAAEAAVAAAAAAHGGAHRRRRHHGRHHYGGQLRQPQGADGPQQQQQQQGHELVSEFDQQRRQFDQHRAQQEGLVDAVALLQGLSVEVAAHMPPAVLMSSLGDHMVQMHEAQEYAARLLAIGVPVKHLVYGGSPIRHNDFVFGLRPLPYPHLPSPSAAGDGSTGGSGSSGGGGGGGVGTAAAAAAAVSEADGLELRDLPPFGRDLLLILLGKVRVRFLTATPAASKL